MLEVEGFGKFQQSSTECVARCLESSWVSSGRVLVSDEQIVILPHPDTEGSDLQKSVPIAHAGDAGT